MYSFVCSVMFIVPVLYKDKGFIQMHLIEDLIGPKATKYLGLFVDALILLFLIYLVPHTLSLSLSETELHSRGLGIPRIYVTIPAPSPYSWPYWLACQTLVTKSKIRV